MLSLLPHVSTHYSSLPLSFSRSLYLYLSLSRTVFYYFGSNHFDFIVFSNILNYIDFMSWGSRHQWYLGMISGSELRIHSWRDSGDHMGWLGLNQGWVLTRQELPTVIFLLQSLDCFLIKLILPLVQKQSLGLLRHSFSPSGNKIDLDFLLSRYRFYHITCCSQRNNVTHDKQLRNPEYSCDISYFFLEKFWKEELGLNMRHPASLRDLSVKRFPTILHWKIVSMISNPDSITEI